MTQCKQQPKYESIDPSVLGASDRNTVEILNMPQPRHVHIDLSELDGIPPPERQPACNEQVDILEGILANRILNDPRLVEGMRHGWLGRTQAIQLAFMEEPARTRKLHRLEDEACRGPGKTARSVS